MRRGDNGQWTAEIDEDLNGKFYTFNVCIDGKWLDDTPGVMAKAVGVNGKRAAILDLSSTDPEGWENDKRPELKSFNDIILYEMHHRDFSLDSLSGINNKGKFLALTEEGTRNIYGQTTGIDHLKELGITHVHILPSYDYASVDETKLDTPQYNWGYDPQNYNVPDGSYSTNGYLGNVSGTWHLSKRNLTFYVGEQEYIKCYVTELWWEYCELQFTLNNETIYTKFKCNKK